MLGEVVSTSLQRADIETGLRSSIFLASLAVHGIFAREHTARSLEFRRWAAAFYFSNFQAESQLIMSRP